jgi:hypothetical protein
MEILDFYAAGTKISDDLIDAILVDDTQSLRRNPQFNKTLFTLHPEAVGMNIRQEPAARPVIRVGHVISYNRAFSGDLTDAGHDEPQ